MPLEVNAQSPEIAKLAEQWPLLEALMGGTPAMRLGGERFLPRFPSEEPAAHQARIKVATLFPAFRRTVSVMAGKPFSKPLTFSAETPPEILKWAEDIDREGVNLDTFAAEMMAEALAYGLCGTLVEAPKPIAGATGTPTKAEQDEAGIRPYFVRVRHNQVLGGRIARVGGKAVLTLLRLLEAGTTEDGPYGEVPVERVRVLRPGSWEVWERRIEGNVDTWVQFEAGVSGLPTIPFVPHYGSRIAYLMGTSPLLDLGYLNVKHWQSQSDQDTILHVARVPVLFAKGFEKEDKITIGASTAVMTTSAAAELKWVEHTGAAIGAGRQSLIDLEEQMIQAGAELLVKKPGQRSATESANDAEANKSDLQRITEGFEDGLDQALQFMADYAKLGTGGNVTLYKDFGAANLADASGQLVLTMEDQGLISQPTAISEMKRRGQLGPEVDAEAEAKAVAAQPPKPARAATTPPIAA